MDKVYEYIDSLNKTIKDGKELPVILTLDPNKQIEKNLNRNFFSGHLFLRKIYYDLGINKICENIKNKYNFALIVTALKDRVNLVRVLGDNIEYKPDVAPKYIYKVSYAENND